MGNWSFILGFSMTLEQFAQAVKGKLSSAGLPLNGGWMPERSSIQVFFARGYSIDDVVEYYAKNVRRYEAWVSMGRG